MITAICLSALPGSTFGTLLSVLPTTTGQRNGYPLWSDEGNGGGKGMLRAEQL